MCCCCYLRRRGGSTLCYHINKKLATSPYNQGTKKQQNHRVLLCRELDWGSALCETEGNILKPSEQTKTKCILPIRAKLPTLIDNIEHYVRLTINIYMVKVNKIEYQLTQ